MTSREWFDKIRDKLESKGYSFTSTYWHDDTEITQRNYCVYFSVKECKKWLFCFKFEYKKDTDDLQNVMLFAKHIYGGSMKSSYSCYRKEIKNIDEHSDSFFFEYMDVLGIVDSIRYHPVIAYYREMCSEDFSDNKSILRRLIGAKKDEVMNRVRDWYWSEYNFNYGYCNLWKIKQSLLKYNDVLKVEVKDWNKLFPYGRHYPRYEMNIYLSNKDTEGYDMFKCLYKPSGKQRWKNKYCHLHFFDEKKKQIFINIDNEVIEDIYGWRFKLRRWLENVLHC